MQPTILESLQQLLVNGPIVTALCVALTEVIKRAAGKRLDPRYLPAISVVLGVLISLALFPFGAATVMAGIVFGLAGTGLWELGKNTMTDKPE